MVAPGVAADAHGEDQVPGRRSRIPGGAFAAQPDLAAVRDAGRDLDLDPPVLGTPALADAPGAGLRDDRTATQTGGAGAREAESPGASLILYRLPKDRVEIVRVVHGARDLRALFR